MPDRFAAADVGGTFTDCVAVTEGGVSVAKVPTSADQSEGVVAGVTRLAGAGRFAGLVHGSTVATNALLERRGADTILITDEGFEDVIEIGRQDRPSLYDSFADRPEPLVERRDRLGAGDLDDLVARVSSRSPESVAVSLAYSFSDPRREEEIGGRLADLGVPVSLSSHVVAEFREFERTSTTVLNAYLWRAVAGYLTRLADMSTPVAERVQVMRSSGGVMDVRLAASLAAALLLSGPAGGVVAATAMARARGYGRVVTFDMGGTSTDVCRVEDGRPELGYERSVAGFVCRMPSVAVHTVGAGGGSIAWLDAGGSLRVGPQSAGADPGPASYGRGGSAATVTDAHLLLGRIDASAPLGGSLALDSSLAESALEALGRQIGLDARTAAAGILEVVESHMERAIRAVSVEQGADPRKATLVAFGGAGGLHATPLARRLGMTAAVVPPYAGVFSALGLLMAPPRHDGARSVMITEEGDGDVGCHVSAIADEVTEAYRGSHGQAPATVTSVVDMRYRGQSHEIAVPISTEEGWTRVRDRFHELHHVINGFARRHDPVEVVTVRAVAEGTPLIGWEGLPELDEGPVPAPSYQAVVMDGRPGRASVWSRAELPAGATIDGPAIVVEDVGTTVLFPGDRGRIDIDGTIEISW